MRLLRIDLVNFRGVAERSTTFAPNGVTVVVGDNETGKSSILEAFDLLVRLPAESKQKRLESVRPVGRDVGTEVRAEFSLGREPDALRLDYRKRWFSERRTELTITDPTGRASSFTGREAHDEAARLFSAHVDTTLWEALVVGQTDTVTLPEARHVSTVLSALEPETTENGSQGSTPLLNRIDLEYQRYFTPRNAKPTGDYAKALSALEDARATVEQAEQRANEVAQDVQQAARLAEDLERLRAWESELGQEIVRWEDERQHSREQLNEVQRLRSEAELADERLNHARTEYDRRTALRTQVDQLAAAVADGRHDLATTTEHLGEAEARLTDHSATLTSARERRAGARERSAALDAELSRSRDRGELSILRDRIDEIERAQATERTAAAARERHPIDATMAQRAEEAHRRVLTARATAHAGAPSIRLWVLGDTPVSVDGSPAERSGEDQPNGHEFTVQTDTTVLADGVLELSIGPGDGAQALRAELAAAEHTEREVWAELGVPDLDAVRSGLRARTEAEHDLELARRTLTARLGGMNLAELTARADALRARLDVAVGSNEASESVDPTSSEPTDISREGDEDALRSELEQARGSEAETIAALTEAEERELAVRKEVEAARDAATRCRVRVEQAEEQLRVAEQVLAAARSGQRDEKLEQHLTDATQHAETVLANHREAADALAASGADRIEDELAKAIGRRDEVARRVETYQGDLRQIEGRLEMAGAQGISSELDRAKAAEAAAERTVQVLRRRAEAASRLTSTIQRHRAEAHRRYAAPLRKRIDDLGRQVYGQSFGVVLDDDLTVFARSLDNVQVPTSALSTGTREQLATIVRLAIAELAGLGGESVPVVLDDALGWSDPRRLRTMGALLEGAGQQGQVLLLTCMPDRYALVPGAQLVRLS